MKVAVVGSGVSGLAATWLLNEHSDHEVHLYEASDRPGGHANTVRFMPGNDSPDGGVDVDTGFIVFNPPTYPNFLRFLKLYPPPENESHGKLPSWPFSLFSSAAPHPTEAPSKGIRILPTEMTFSVCRDGGAFEWAGKNPLTLFCQPTRFFDPNMWQMIYDIFRFNACARRFLRQHAEHSISIGQYLEKERYSDAFKDNYLIPMTAAVWSTPPDTCFDHFPAHTLIQFMYNHSLLQITGKPNWLTICGGSHHYVNQILGQLPQSQLHLSSRVNCISSMPNAEPGAPPQLELVTGDEERFVYDHVILACHSDEALRILQAGDIREEEARILESFEWNMNKVILHSDPQLMPRARSAWSCWNYLTFSDGKDKANVNRVSLTYGMNDLQHIPEHKYGPVLATLNPPPEIEIDEIKIQGCWNYEHPVLNARAIKAQQDMHKIQNKRSISFAGAYLKYGFHEDGFTSGLLAACSVEDKGLYERLKEKFADVSARPTCSKTIETRNVTVRPPFAIEHADHHLYLQESASEMVAEYLFRGFEGSGLRAIVSAVGSLLLGLGEFVLMTLPLSIFSMIGLVRTGDHLKTQ